MAYDNSPSAWITGWSEDGTDITIANLTTAFPELTVAEADAVGTTEDPAGTGDICEVLYAICQELADVWYGTAAADRPSNMTIARSTSTDETTGYDTKQFVFRFVTEVAAGSRGVVAEA